jgi:hypothetical protein
MLAGQHYRVRQEGTFEGRPRFVCTLPSHQTVIEHAAAFEWFPVGQITELMVSEAAKLAIAQQVEQERRRRNEVLIAREKEKVAEELGIIDLQLINMASFGEIQVVEQPNGEFVVAGVREALERLKRESGQYFRPELPAPAPEPEPEQRRPPPSPPRKPPGGAA